MEPMPRRSLRQPGNLIDRQRTAPDPDIIEGDDSLARARAEVQSEPVAGLGPPGELPGGDALAIRMQTLPAGANGGNDLERTPWDEICPTDLPPLPR